MMMRPSLFLTSVFIGALTMVHSQRLKPLTDSFEIVTGVVIPCGSSCVVQNYREVLQTTERCIISSTGLYPEVEQYLRTNNLIDTNGNGPTYQLIYDAMFSEGRSPLCGWYRKHGECLRRGFGQDCGSGILQALTTIFENFNPLICSENPNYIACATHPSLFGDLNSQQNNSPYARCAITLADNFMNIDYQNYYNSVILRDNGAFLFNNLRTFGNCIGDAVRTVTGPTGCSTAGEDIKKYINDTLDYFHFGMNGKDYLKCFAKPDLHSDLTECGETFENDLKSLYGDSFLTVLNTTLLNGQYQGLHRPYTRLSSCFKTAMNMNCGSEQDSVTLVTRMLHPLDHLFGIRSASPAFCGAPIPTPTPQPPATRPKPLKDAFEVTTEVIIPCGSRCVVRRYRDILQAANTCIMSNSGVQMEVERYIQTSNLGNNPSWNMVYEAFFAEGRSPLCGWYRRFGRCFENQFGRICGSGVMEAITGLLDDFEMLVCSDNPNYLACITHPSLINDQAGSVTGPYERCLQQAMTAFSNVNSNNYYQALMLNRGGELLFSTIRNFGNCTGEAIKTVPVSPPTGCPVVGNEVKKYINDAVNYFDFGQNGKDYVKCFARSSLHTELTNCGERFGSDLEMKFDDMTLAQLNMTLYIGGYSALEQPYRRLSACIKRAMVVNCRQETDSINLVNRILHPLDHLYGIRGDNPTYCDGSSAAAVTSVANLGLLFSSLLMLLSIILRLK